MLVGFTGTQNGMTELQQAGVLALLHGCGPDDEFHYGDCIGADHEAFEMAEKLDMVTVCHPPIIQAKRAFTRAQIMLTPRAYLERNHAIVLACDWLIAAPSGMDEELRSGTWATVRAARKQKKTIWFAFPDGTIKEERAK